MGELGTGNGTSYPTALDTDTVTEVNSPNAGKTKARAELPNDGNAAIIALETELGTDPAGTTTDVKTFLQLEHNTDGTHNIAATSLRAGQPVQVVHTQSGAVATGTTVLPFDDTAPPQITEGDEYITRAITPTNASNKLLIEVVIILASGAAGQMSVALFQDTTANALAAVSEYIATADDEVTVAFRHEMAAGTTSSTTFRVRAGNDQAGTTTYNGSAAGRIFGGVAASSVRITEVKV